MAVKPIPEGYHTVTPYLAVEDAAAAIEFYKRAFGARERSRIPSPDGKVAHAELEIGDSLIMLADPFPHAKPEPPRHKPIAVRSGSTSSQPAEAVLKNNHALARGLAASAVGGGARLAPSPKAAFATREEARAAMARALQARTSGRAAAG